VALRPHVAEPGAQPAAAGASAASAQPCGGLGRAVARAFRQDKPQILHIGPLCGESVVYLAGRGAKVHVDEIDVPAPIPERKPGESAAAVAPFHIDLPSGLFDLVLAWEFFDFVPPDRLQEFGAEVARVIRVGGQLLVFAHQKPPADHAVIPRYRVLADDLIVREEPAGPARRRYTHANRDLERALAGLSVQGIQLQRNQLREILASKAGVG
jgi:hypothetical protein